MVQIPPTLVRDWLGAAMRRWGRPEGVRVDNGWPWGTHNDLPTGLALWLWGLGVQVSWNPPARPQRNAKVERCHGLLDQWGEPSACAGWGEWTRRLDWLLDTQRRRYPAVRGRSRLEAHPELLENPRPHEQAGSVAWDLERVCAQLASGRWVRLVSKVGCITLYRRDYGVGRSWRGQEVHVRFAPEARQWVVTDALGRELARHPAQEITTEAIEGIKLGYRKPHEQPAEPLPPLEQYFWVT